MNASNAKFARSMKSKAELPLSSQISSLASICFYSIVASLSVFLVAILIQWFVYDDWMHKNGPLRLVGSTFAAAITFVFVYHWLLGLRERKLEMLRRFERIKWMNDRIRNSLQAIEFVVYATNPHVTDPVKEAVEAIESVLREVLVETDASSRTRVDGASSFRISPTDAAGNGCQVAYGLSKECPEIAPADLLSANLLMDTDGKAPTDTENDARQ